MKLKANITPEKPMIERIKLSSELVNLLNHYLKYYEICYGFSIKFDQMIVEIIDAFVKSDRGFIRWFKEEGQTIIKNRSSHEKN